MYVFKGCPFCGTTPETAIVIANAGMVSNTVYLKIKCPECGIEKIKTIGITKDSTFDDVVDSIDEIVTIWNTRADLDD